MKRVCFIEFEGILESNLSYKIDAVKTKSFLKSIKDYCDKNGVELILLSGFHHKVAEEKFKKSFVKNFFKKHNFFYVDDNYLNSKAEIDKNLHIENLKKDKEFTDSYFKQVLIQQFLYDNNIKSTEALLLCNDIWVDAYYTTRFSKVDFALFEYNILDRGKKSDRISGLAYFNLDSKSVEMLLENFPNIDLSLLDKFVFQKMQEALLKDVDFSDIAKKAKEKKFSDLNETKIDEGN